MGYSPHRRCGRRPCAKRGLSRKCRKSGHPAPKRKNIYLLYRTGPGKTRCIFADSFPFPRRGFGRKHQKFHRISTPKVKDLFAFPAFIYYNRIYKRKNTKANQTFLCFSTLRAGEKKALSGAPAPRPARLCAGGAAWEIRLKPSESRQIGQFRCLSNGCQYGILIPSREREGPETQNSERKRFHVVLRPQGGGTAEMPPGTPLLKSCTAGSGKSRGSSPPEAGKNQ